MTHIGVFGIIAIIAIVLTLLGWVFMTVLADRDPAQIKTRGGKLKRGPVSGGAIRGDPGQNFLTGDAPRQDEPGSDRHGAGSDRHEGDSDRHGADQA